MTRQEFNMKFYIEAIFLTYQNASLEEDSSFGDLEYGSMEELHGIVKYTVMTHGDHKPVMSYESSDEYLFLEELKEKFNIVD